ncbi:MAG: beta-glucosidase [Chthoniobacterales bacterium]|nr:beta-glucosidase [Chthoniobacterales bacterium]
MNFGKNFVWGAATASFQVEGAAQEEGKGLSVWDVMCQRSGKIWQGHSGDIACNHYHRYKEDVALMKEIGLKAYRFSISWPRVLPLGIGKVNEAGLAFYDRLVDELLSLDIVPWVTLFHWDFPYELYCKGGWLNRESVEWFADYTSIIINRLSDRVAHWMTLNEPQCFIGFGMESGMHAPADQLGRKEILRAAHHVLLAHGRSVQVIRSSAKSKPMIGWAPVVFTAYPASNRESDIAAARETMFAHESCSKIINDRNISVWNNTWWGDPVVFGNYPQDTWNAFGDAVPRIETDDMKIISQPIDFYGANIYTGLEVYKDSNGKTAATIPPAGAALTAFRWPVTPDCLEWGVKLLYERYQQPIVITENGISCHDWPSLDGKVHDPQRIDFLHRYLCSLAKSIKEGVDIRGYFQWSLMDNFEWAEGYKERFGLIYIDYPTQKRILKDSATWYRSVIESNGEVLHSKFRSS